MILVLPRSSAASLVSPVRWDSPAFVIRVLLRLRSERFAKPRTCAMAESVA